VWSDATPDGACNSGADDCIFKDNISGIMWSEPQPVSGAAPAASTAIWSDAVSGCNDLTYGGYSDWRLPTQIEMMDAYSHGIRDVTYHTTPAGTTFNNQYFTVSNFDNAWVWTATSYSFKGGPSPNTAYAYKVFANGQVAAQSKGVSTGTTYFCVRQ
jgi:hypothetical protein